MDEMLKSTEPVEETISVRLDDTVWVSWLVEVVETLRMIVSEKVAGSVEVVGPLGLVE